MPTFADFDFTPEPGQIEQIYLSGFKGVLNEGRLSHAAFRGSSPRLYDLHPQAKGISQDVEVCLPIRAIQTVCGQDFCASSGEAQRQGDCLVAGSRVSMADGSEKNIEEVKVDDRVIDHNGRARKVIRQIKRPYSGDILRIRAGTYGRAINVTPDHQIFSLSMTPWGLLPNTLPNSGGWMKARDLATGTEIHTVDGPRPIGAIEASTASTTVYCLEVEEGRSFIANGIKVHNCVGKCVKGMGLIDGCIDHLFGETSWVKDSNGMGVLYCDENFYGDRGHSGEGADCWRLWNSASLDGRQGFLFRQAYEIGGKTYDLSKYRPDLSGPWGRSGTPDDLSGIANKNPALEVVRAKSTEELMDGLVLGMGGGRCGGQGYSSKRNDDGLSERSGGWNHAISIGGFIRTKPVVEKYGGVIFLYYHFWGQWNSGPKPYEIPDGSWFVRQKEVDDCIRQGECALLGSVVGVDRKLRWEKLMDRKSWLIKEGYLAA